MERISTAMAVVAALLFATVSLTPAHASLFGSVRIGDTTLTGGDAITLSGPASLEIAASDKSQVLFFDVA